MNTRIVLTLVSALCAGLLFDVCLHLMNVPDNGAFVLGAVGGLSTLLAEIAVLKRIWSV